MSARASATELVVVPAGAPEIVPVFRALSAIAAANPPRLLWRVLRAGCALVLWFLTRGKAA